MKGFKASVLYGFIMMSALAVILTACGSGGGGGGGESPVTPTEKTTVSLARTGQTESSATGDDGDLQKGVAWPEQRFAAGTAAEANCVTDNLTGLMWAKDGNLAGSAKIWQEALDYVASLNSGKNGLCGYNDWRLPNVNELESLVNSGQENTAGWFNLLNFINQGFISNVQADYWSSTTYASDTDYAWYVDMWHGLVYKDEKAVDSWVWPVRSGQEGAAAELPRTGQTESSATGDDGDLQKGVAWPELRFTNNNNGTITDNLTGLIWLENASCFGAETWSDALTAANTLANDNANCGLTDGSQAGDWRLPNRKELMSLIDRSGYNPALPANPFANMPADYYWSSTTYAGNIDFAWFVNMRYGYVSYNYKTSAPGYYVWPVRSGQ